MSFKLYTPWSPWAPCTNPDLDKLKNKPSDPTALVAPMGIATPMGTPPIGVYIGEVGEDYLGRFCFFQRILSMIVREISKRICATIIENLCDYYTE